MARTTQHSKSALLSLFPPPAFLTMPAMGVDISDRSIKFVELVERHGQCVLSRFGDYDLAEGVVSGGEIHNMEKLVDVLTKLQRKYRAMFVRAALPEQQAYVFQTEIPAVESEAQLMQQLEFKLEENVPLSPREVVLGYEALELKGSGGRQAVTVTAFPRHAAEAYESAFRQAHLTPLSFEIESQAIARSVIAEDDPSTYLIVDFGETRTGLAIVASGFLAFTSTLEVPGSSLTEAIRKHHPGDAEEIVRIKNEEGIESSSSPALHEALLDVVTSLAAGIERHYSYWNVRAEDDASEHAVKKVLLCGGNANLAGLPEYLTSQLRAPVERANVWVNAFSFEDVIPEMPFEQSLSYATAVGLALRRTR